jgi:glycine/D-amino acid oxidase-like deaminating enzyme
MKHNAHGFWLEEAGDAEPAPKLSGELSADVVVIGGGYTGMWAAWQIKRLEPGASVVLLESEICGHGPSGRNGGFCNVMWFSLPNMRARWGDEAALAVARASQQAVEGIETFCREQGVDAWFRRGGYLQVSTAPAHDGVWDEAVTACRELGAGEAAQPLAPDEVGERCASPAFRGGAFYPDAATVQPARLALGLRERLRTAGVEIYEHSPVRRLAASDFVGARTPTKSDTRIGGALAPASSGSGGVVARTDRGLVRAGAAVVAIGGAAKAPGAPLRNALTVTSSHIVLTEPVPDLLEEIGWTGGECITDSRTLIDYFRTTPDGRIAFGWGGGRIAMGARLHGRAERAPDVVAAAATRLREYFPGLAGRRITHAWGGPVDVSPTHTPMIVPLPRRNASTGHTGNASSVPPFAHSGHSANVFIAAGYTGNGVGPSYMVGRTLASLALGHDDDHSRLPIVDPNPQHVPPEPFHWLGGETIRRALVSKENAELSGQRPHPISALISRIPKLIGVHIGR